MQPLDSGHAREREGHRERGAIAHGYAWGGGRITRRLADLKYKIIMVIVIPGSAGPWATFCCWPSR